MDCNAHPFTAPKKEHEGMLTSDPGACLSQAYDMVINGSEVGGGPYGYTKWTFRKQYLQQWEFRTKKPEISLVSA